jgi:hypothetical protein
MSSTLISRLHFCVFSLSFHFARALSAEISFNLARLFLYVFICAQSQQSGPRREWSMKNDLLTPFLIDNHQFVIAGLCHSEPQHIHLIQYIIWSWFVVAGCVCV